MALLDLWYADDGCLLGEESEVLRAYASLLVPLAAIGLAINPAKCQLWRQTPLSGGESSAHPVPTVDAASSSTAFTVLGLPVAGHAAAMGSFATSAVAKAASASAAIASLHHAQGEATLLRACGPTSRLRHLLRFGIDASVRSALPQADEATLQHAARIIGRPLPPGWEDTAASPVNAGALDGSSWRLDCRAFSS